MSSETQPSTPLTALSRRARDAGYEPWLFHRDGLDWCWRSYRRVADHVARGVETLRAAVVVGPEAREGTGSGRAGYADRQHPDAIAAGLAIRAAGWAAVPVSSGPEEAASLGCGLWVEPSAGDGRAPAVPGADIERVELPQVAPVLDRTPPRLLDLDAPEGAVEIPGCGPASAADLASSVRRLDQRLAATAGRPIVCAAPGLDSATARLLEAWTVLRGAAWVLEPEPDAFGATVLWARPTIVWAPAAELERLASRLAARKRRRRSRLSAVVVAGGEEVAQAAWRALGVAVVDLGRAR